MMKFVFFFFNDTATTEIYTLSLHDALPIFLYINASSGNGAGHWPHPERSTSAPLAVKGNGEPEMNVRPQEMAPREFYRLLITSVVPRPIAWGSSISKEGIHNLAPFSFFNALSATPPLLGFCRGIGSQELREARGTGVKDTLRNVRETGELVVNLVPFALAEQMNLTAGEYEATVDEFEVAKLTMRPSPIIRPPQVAESPVSFECKDFQILDFGTDTAGGGLGGGGKL